MKNSNDTIGNRTRDLPACSGVPQPSAPPRAPTLFPSWIKKHTIWSGHIPPYLLNIGIREASVQLNNTVALSAEKQRPTATAKTFFWDVTTKIQRATHVAPIADARTFRLTAMINTVYAYPYAWVKFQHDKFLVITNLTHFFLYLFISCLYMFRVS